jgi:hypothetical protein
VRTQSFFGDDRMTHDAGGGGGGNNGDNEMVMRELLGMKRMMENLVRQLKLLEANQQHLLSSVNNNQMHTGGEGGGDGAGGAGPGVRIGSVLDDAGSMDSFASGVVSRAHSRPSGVRIARDHKASKPDGLGLVFQLPTQVHRGSPIGDQSRLAPRVSFGQPQPPSTAGQDRVAFREDVVVGPQQQKLLQRRDGSVDGSSPAPATAQPAVAFQLGAARPPRPPLPPARPPAALPGTLEANSPHQQAQEPRPFENMARMDQEDKVEGRDAAPAVVPMVEDLDNNNEAGEEEEEQEEEEIEDLVGRVSKAASEVLPMPRMLSDQRRMADRAVLPQPPQAGPDASSVSAGNRLP